MNPTTIALVLFLAAIGAWMWWRIRRMPPPSATPKPAVSVVQSDFERDVQIHEVIMGMNGKYDPDALRKIPAEYAGRADLEQVVLLNDDTTPMDLVMLVLQNVFQFSSDLAFHATIAAHTEGECVIAVLPREVAAERIAAAREIMEKTGGYPLQIIARPLPSEAERPATAPA